MATITSPATVTASSGLQGSLGPIAIVFMVVAAAAPLTVVGGGTPVGIMLGNGAGFPLNYVVSGVILLLFSVGMSAMTRHIAKPGAFFTYIGTALSRPLGVGSAFVALATYTMVQVGVYGFLGDQLRIVTTGLGLPSIPWWVFALLMVAVVGLFGYRKIELSSKVLGVLLLGEMGIVAALSVAIFLKGGAEGISLAPFSLTEALKGSPGVGLTFAVAGFVGFESTAIFRDEAKNPTRTIPLATYIAIIALGVFFAVASWALVLAWGPSNIVAAASADPAGIIVTTASTYLGAPAALVMQVLFLTSMFACVLAFHNVIARYLHAMAGSSVMPKSLHAVHDSFGSPHAASVVQTASAVIIIAACALLGMDPVLQVFSWGSGISVLGVLVLMALTCAAVLVFFQKNPGLDNRVWHTKIAPGLGLVGLVALTYIVAVNFPTLIGGDAPLAIALGGIIIVALVIGIGVAFTLKRRSPHLYATVIDAIAA